MTHLSHLVPCHHSSTQGAAKSLPSRFREMRMTLLLLSSRVLSRGSLGKPSSRTMTLSERSRLSNWFCTSSARLQCLFACLVFSAVCLTTLQRSTGRQRQHTCCVCFARHGKEHTSVAPKFSIADSLCPAEVLLAIQFSLTS